MILCFRDLCVCVCVFLFELKYTRHTLYYKPRNIRLFNCKVACFTMDKINCWKVLFSLDLKSLS
jgi:hypothetical protein